MGLKAIILAAGKGTRMKSEIVKVAHRVAGKPIVSYIVDTVSKLGVDEQFLVVGHQADRLKGAIKAANLQFVLQKEQLGTGHAVVQVADHLDENSNDSVIILPGDCPLVSEDTLRTLVAIHQESNAAGTILTAKMAKPANYGRILRGEMGTVIGIKEAKDCSDKEKRIKEINTAIYVFHINSLFKAIKKVKTNNAQKEYYLTDVIQILKEAGEVISAHCIEDADEVIGVNTRVDLAKINKIIYRKNNFHFMKEGITILDPDTTFIDSTVSIGHDTVIYPFCIIEGKTKIGKHCKIGPYAHLKDVVVNDGGLREP